MPTVLEITPRAREAGRQLAAISPLRSAESPALPAHPRAVLVVGALSALTDLVFRTLSLGWPERAPIVLPRRMDAEHYLSASADAGRPPAAVILSIQGAGQDEPVDLLRWIRGQNERLRHTPVILVGNDVEPAPDLGNDLFSLFLQHADLGAMTHALARALRHEAWVGTLDPAL
jgi:hypothetical protein